MRAVVAVAGVAICLRRAEGHYVEYLRQQKELLSRVGSTCAYKRYMLKHDPACVKNASTPGDKQASAAKRRMRRSSRGRTTAKAPPPKNCVRPLFITGCGGSGTHFVTAFLAHMRVVGGVTHEDPRPSASVVVSWAARHGPALLSGKWGKYPAYGVQQKALRQGMVHWAARQSVAACSYKVVAHVVRHPLKVFSSSVAFGQCVECWVHIEEFVMPRFTNGTDLTKSVRAAIYANRASKRRTMGGREWSKDSIDTLVEGFALYWLAWNAMIEPVADYRFQVEHADYVQLCRLAGVADDDCRRAAAATSTNAHKLQTGNHGGSTLRITWPQLSRINLELSSEVWKLAQRYGYSREPPSTRQPAANAATRVLSV